jgi:hypothetical protein
LRKQLRWGEWNVDGILETDFGDRKGVVYDVKVQMIACNKCFH